MGNLREAHANQYEVILFAQKGNKRLNCIPTKDGTLNKHGNPELCRHPDVLEFNRAANGKTMLHNHQKPTDLIEFLVKKSSKEGNIALDGFLGSGTTAEASANLKRNWIGIEIDPKISRIAKKKVKLFYGTIILFDGYELCLRLAPNFSKFWHCKWFAIAIFRLP